MCIFADLLRFILCSEVYPQRRLLSIFVHLLETICTKNRRDLAIFSLSINAVILI